LRIEMQDREFKRATGRAWLLVAVAALFIILFTLFAFRVNRDEKTPRWDMGGVEFVPASSRYADDYHEPFQDTVRWRNGKGGK
jgi:hypothetical protein